MNKIYVANWKMNKNIEEIKQFFDEFLPLVKNCENEVYIAVNAVGLQEAVKCAKNSKVQIAAQNAYTEDSGAFTGEISFPMLEGVGVKSVMLGHSERRIYFGETDEFINKKIKKAVEKGFKVIFCVGEKEEERNNKQTENVLRNQIMNGLDGISAEQMQNVYVAYEPVWSISTFSTGRTATIDEIFEVHNLIKDILKEMYPETYNNIKVLYGGSVSPKNCDEIMKLENVDGALIGGASLKADSLFTVVK